MENKQNTKRRRVSATKSKLRRIFESRGLYIALCAFAASAIIFTFAGKFGGNPSNETSFDESAWLEAVNQSGKTKESDTAASNSNDGSDNGSKDGSETSESGSDSGAVSDSAYSIVAGGGTQAEISASDVIDIDNPDKYAVEDLNGGDTAVLASAQPTSLSDNTPPKLAEPCAGRIIAECSLDDLVYCAATDDWRTHNGVDYAAAEGENVYAAAAGKVSKVYTDDLLGVTVVIDHGDNLCTLYSSLTDEDFIKVGTVVSQGDLIGNIGKSCGLEKGLEPHLHFEVSKNGTPQNPKDFR